MKMFLGKQLISLDFLKKIFGVYCVYLYGRYA